MFCETTKKTHDLEKEIQGAFEFIDGDIVSYDDFLVGSEGEKVRDGKVVERHSCPQIWDVTTNSGNVYRVSIQNQEICLECPEYEGFSEITISHIDPDSKELDKRIETYEIGEYIDYNLGKMSPASKAAEGWRSQPLATLNDGASPLLKISY